MSNFEKKVVPYLTYLGLRPGEKLYEEKLMAEEGIKKTDNELIHMCHLYSLGFFAFKNTRKMTNYVEKQNMYFEITNNWAKDGCDKI